MDCPIHRWSLETPNAPALIFEGTVLTFSALAARTGAWEDALRRHGVHPGGRVALLSTNHPDLVCIMLATLRLHATCVPLNARLMPPELATLLQLIRPELTLAHPALKERVPGALCFADPVLTPGMPSQTWLDDDAVAFILFTSGTTGTPKGAQLSVANLQASANANAENLGPSNQQQRWLASLPLCHVGGLAMMWRCLVGGGWSIAGATRVLPLNLDQEATVWQVARVPEETGNMWTARLPSTGSRVHLPRDADKIAMRVNPYTHPKQKEKLYAGYFFIANGGHCDRAEDVRLLAFRLTDSYAYYLKVQVSSQTVQSEEEFARMSGSLVGELLPDIMRCVPDWVEVLRGEYPDDNPRRASAAK